MPNLKVERLSKYEVNRGWVRINIKSREYIKRGSLCKIEYDNRAIYRIVLGHDTPGTLFIDRYARDELNCQLSDNPEYFEIKSVICPIEQLYFYWNHPDFPLRFSTRLAFILGITSIALGIISLIK